jgi:hypothetical protein
VKGIIFSGKSPRQITYNAKTQTRRVVKFPRGVDVSTAVAVTFDEYRERFKTVPDDLLPYLIGKPWSGQALLVNGPDIGYSVVECPYGTIGDRLWVRETFFDHGSPNESTSERVDERIEYRADEWNRVTPTEGGWRPSIHMPRWASRITLEITDVRVQRLCEISEDDAIAEGVEPLHQGYYPYGIKTCFTTVENGREVPAQYCPTARHSFERLWRSLNAKRSPWERNDWVWALTFKVVSL